MMDGAGGLEAGAKKGAVAPMAEGGLSPRQIDPVPP